MLTVTTRQLWYYLNNGGKEFELPDDPDDCEDCPFYQETLHALHKCDLKNILAGQYMSEERLGGDDLCGMADDVVAAIKEGYEIISWYGDDAEALVAGYKPAELTITC